jgi:E3 ubiquitin-protein ligase UHRF1
MQRVLKCSCICCDAEFSCSLCKKVLTLPLSTPCGHNFCKPCIEGIFAGQQDVRERSGVGGRSLRAQKIVKRCPSCQGDITDFLVKPQVLMFPVFSYF